MNEAWQKLNKLISTTNLEFEDDYQGEALTTFRKLAQAVQVAKEQLETVHCEADDLAQIKGLMQTLEEHEGVAWSRLKDSNSPLMVRHNKTLHRQLQGVLDLRRAAKSGISDEGEMLFGGTIKSPIDISRRRWLKACRKLPQRKKRCQHLVRCGAIAWVSVRPRCVAS